MKLLISFVTALVLVFTMVNVSNAATATETTITKTTKTVVKNKHYYPCRYYKHKKYKRHYYGVNVNTYYAPEYCVADPCACGGVVCYPGYYYQCHTVYYHHSGRNTARVEECY